MSWSPNWGCVTLRYVAASIPVRVLVPHSHDRRNLNVVLFCRSTTSWSSLGSVMTWTVPCVSAWRKRFVVFFINTKNTLNIPKLYKLSLKITYMCMTFFLCYFSTSQRLEQRERSKQHAQEMKRRLKEGPRKELWTFKCNTVTGTLYFTCYVIGRLGRMLQQGCAATAAVFRCSEGGVIVTDVFFFSSSSSTQNRNYRKILAVWIWINIITSIHFDWVLLLAIIIHFPSVTTMLRLHERNSGWW